MKKRNYLSRRQMLVSASSSMVLGPLIVLAGEGSKDIFVVKSPGCGCCEAWVEILRDNGFHVTTENLSSDLLVKFKIESGVPKDMMSCHTAKIEGYFIEGHVPTEDINRLISERPNALGLVVPGMPYGSPGMGPEEKRESYNVFLIRSNRTPELFNHYPKAGLLV